jgi:hypothetical protein
MRRPSQREVGNFFLIAMLLFMTNLKKSFADERHPSMHGEYSIDLAYHTLSGNGSKALLHRGLFLTNEVNLKLNEPFGNGWNFFTHMDVRKTADPQIDKRKDVHILGVTSEIYNPTLHFTLGDFYGDFSQYTLAQALEGLQIYVKTERIQTKVVTGISQKGDEGRQFMRIVYGGNIETLLIKDSESVKDFKLGVNFLSNNDDGHSIKNKTNVKEVANRVGSINAHILLWDKVDLNGEVAHSWTDEDTSPGSQVDPKVGNALRLNSKIRFSKKAKLKLGYEWVVATFDSLNGSAVPDRANLNSQFDYKLSEACGWEAGYRIWHDKLSKSTLSKRTVTQAPRLLLKWTAAPERGVLLKDFSSRMYWEMRRRVSQDDPAGQTDFSSNDFGLESDFKLNKIKWNAGWNLHIEDDDLNKVNNRFSNSGWLGWRRAGHILGIETVSSVRGNFNYIDIPKEDGHDFIYGISWGFDSDISPPLRLEQRYSVERAHLLAAESNSTKFRSYLGLEYRLPGADDRRIKASYEYTNFAHSQEDECFAEHNLQVKLLWTF